MHTTVPILVQVLTPIDRAGLLDDAFALSYAGQLDTMVAMNLSIYLVYERDYIPWEVAISWFYRFDGLLSLTPFYGNYKVSGWRRWVEPMGVVCVSH